MPCEETEVVSWLVSPLPLSQLCQPDHKKQFLFIYLFTYSFVCLFVYFIYSNAIISEDIDFI